MFLFRNRNLNILRILYGLVGTIYNRQMSRRKRDRLRKVHKEKRVRAEYSGLPLMKLVEKETITQ